MSSVATLALLSSPLMADATCDISSQFPPTQFADNSDCDNIGLSDLTPFLHGKLLSETGTDSAGFIPYLSSVPLTETQPAVTTAVIWIHGLLGNANKFFCDGISSATAAGVSASTVTVAPWFGDAKITAAAWNPDLTNGSHSTCWDGASWLGGGDAYDPERAPSAFGALDEIVGLLNDKNKFPNLVQITVAGFSAGCQMASRWVFFSPAALSTRVVVGDCGTYMYLDTTRPNASCSQLENTGTTHTCSSFETPDANACSDFDNYKYGFNFTDLDDQNSYVQAYADDSSKLQDAIQNFTQKDFRLILGNQDYCQCNVDGMNNEASCFHGADMGCSPSIFSGCCDTYPDSTSEDACDYGCAAMLEGSNRLQRGLNYASYLKNLFAQRGVNYDPPVAFFDGAHNNTAWAFSPDFSQWVGWTTQGAMV